MSLIVEKVLRSGLVDRAMVEFMEKTGMLPEGSADTVPDEKNALKNALRVAISERDGAQAEASAAKRERATRVALAYEDSAMLAEREVPNPSIERDACLRVAVAIRSRK